MISFFGVHGILQDATALFKLSCPLRMGMASVSHIFITGLASGSLHDLSPQTAARCNLTALIENTERGYANLFQAVVAARGLGTDRRSQVCRVQDLRC